MCVSQSGSPDHWGKKKIKVKQETRGLFRRHSGCHQSVNGGLFTRGSDTNFILFFMSIHWKEAHRNSKFRFFELRWFVVLVNVPLKLYWLGSKHQLTNKPYSCRGRHRSSINNVADVTIDISKKSSWLLFCVFFSSPSSITVSLHPFPPIFF